VVLRDDLDVLPQLLHLRRRAGASARGEERARGEWAGAP
jgi:hypothetical protein